MVDAYFRDLRSELFHTKRSFLEASSVSPSLWLKAVWKGLVQLIRDPRYLPCVVVGTADPSEYVSAVWSDLGCVRSSVLL